MKIGLRLHDAEKLPIEKLLPIVKSRGFDCVHLALSKSVPHYSDDILTPEYAAYLRDLFDANSLEIAVLGCYFDLSEDFERYEKHIRFAALLKPLVMGTETNCRSFDSFERNIAKCAELAGELGVKFAIEPVAGHLVDSPRKALELAAKYPSLRIILDPVNLLSPKNLQSSGEIIQEACEMLGQYTDVVHIKDFVSEKDKLRAVAAGCGEFEYGSIAEFLRENPRLCVTLENTSPENAQASLEFIKRQIRGEE